MMDLQEQGQVADSALPVTAFRAHLALGRGFADEAAQDDLLRAVLRAAIRTVEGRISKVLLTRSFVLRLACWRSGAAQTLPLAPVSDVAQVALIDRTGAVAVLSPARWHLQRDAHRPRVVASAGLWPAIPAQGAVEITFDAGFGPDWADVPADLVQAVFLLATRYYEHRGGAEAEISPDVVALIAPYRSIRLFGGGA
ncbi:head-tail connector protein [Roseicitreum antarcticum]|nr:hypothetical protein [Roseicitreum antarcticum]